MNKNMPLSESAVNSFSARGWGGCSGGDCEWAIIPGNIKNRMPANIDLNAINKRVFDAAKEKLPKCVQNDLTLTFDMNLMNQTISIEVSSPRDGPDRQLIAKFVDSITNEIVAGVYQTAQLLRKD